MDIPQPVVVATVCSLCDEPWEDHGPEPTVLDCIRLLKARPYQTVIVNPSPWVPIQPAWPGWTINCGSDTIAGPSLPSGYTVNWDPNDPTIVSTFTEIPPNTDVILTV